MGLQPRVALVCGVPIGDGGLAVQAANAVAALADPRVALHVVAPEPDHWPRSGDRPAAEWHGLPPAAPRWAALRPLRSLRGLAQRTHDRALGAAAAARLERISPDIVYAFTQVGLESLRWARARGIPSVLDSPNGHIRHFRSVYVSEHRRWCHGPYLGHPTPAMVRRVEEEYRLADRIRVSSEWSRQSLLTGGVPSTKIVVIAQPVDLEKYRPVVREAPNGPLRTVMVSTLDLRKGFVYLLDAVRKTGNGVSLEIVGGTVDRCSKLLLATHSRELPVTVQAGDPRPAYARAELAVLPTLEDGFGFAVAEALASGLPVLTTEACGAAEWVDPGAAGWIVPAASSAALADALADALRRRHELPAMGAFARAEAQRRGDRTICDRALTDWVLNMLPRHASGAPPLLLR